MNHLQEAVRTHFSALTSLKQHAAQLREEKEEAERKAEDMKLKMQVRSRLKFKGLSFLYTVVILFHEEWCIR